MSNFWQEIKKPILMLSPMAGYTDSAFRIVCKNQGANLLMTELVSADAIAHFADKMNKNTKSQTINSKQIQISKSKIQNNTTLEIMQFHNAEMPIIIQLFGKNPENFAKAAIWIEKNLTPSGIDINFGCPAKKVVHSGHGAALMKDHNLAIQIVKATCEATTLPTSVKTRLGWENDDEILEFGPKLISAGVSALIVHGRTYRDGFSGEARWENIYKLKVKSKKSKVKIIGNGDIKNYSDIKDKLKNLDGVAIGRGAIGNPFIFNPEFAELEKSLAKDGRIGWAPRNSAFSLTNNYDKKIKEDEKNKEKLILSDTEKKILEIKKKTALEHAKLAFDFFGEKGIIELRKHLLWYFKGHPRAKELRKQFVAVENINDVKKVLVRMDDE